MPPANPSATEHAAFIADLAGERVRGAREICLIGGLMYLAFALLDPIAIPSAWPQVWAIRAAVIALVAGFYLLTTRPQFLRYYTPLILALFGVFGLGIEAMIALAGPADLARSTYYSGMFLVLMALYTWVLVPTWMATAAGMSLVLLYIAIALLVLDMGGAGEGALLFTQASLFTGANVAGTFISLHRNRHLRDSYRLRQQLASELARTAAAKAHSDYWSEHDALTGLPNRKHLATRLAALLAAARARGDRVAVLFIDLDRFKQINDRLGHAAGDRVLQQLAQRLHGCLRADDLDARIGGDEFAAALRLSPAHAAVAGRVARAAIAAIEMPLREPDIGTQLSASIGIAWAPEDGDDPDSLLRVADARMYQGKRRGGGTVVGAAAAADTAPA